MAFANDINTPKISPSLKKIFECVERECYDGLLIQPDITLESWAQQGVLLLNTSLTFEKFKGGHFNVWKKFTESFLKHLHPIIGIHICLWGSHAKAFKQFLNEKHHYIHEFVHPAYASYKNIDWKCTHFEDINKLIYENNGKEEIIAW